MYKYSPTVVPVTCKESRLVALENISLGLLPTVYGFRRLTDSLSVNSSRPGMPNHSSTSGKSTSAVGGTDWTSPWPWQLLWPSSCDWRWRATLSPTHAWHTAPSSVCFASGSSRCVAYRDSWIGGAKVGAWEVGLQTRLTHEIEWELQSFAHEVIRLFILFCHRALVQRDLAIYYVDPCQAWFGSM